MTQDSFVKAWQKLGDFNCDSSFATWIHRIAINTTLSYLRKAKRRLSLLPSPTQRVARPMEDQRMDLEDAIVQLPERARLVFVLHDVEGYRHQDIADKLDIAVGTSKAHLHSARKQLVKSLNR